MEIAADMREGLLASAVDAGLQVMGQLMEAEVTAGAGRGASTTWTGSRPDTAPSPGRWPWVGAGCRCVVRASAIDGIGGDASGGLRAVQRH